MTGGDALEKKLSEIAAKIGRGGTLRVGFLENSSYPDGTSVAQVAAWNNFGTTTSPARPFFTNWIADKSGAWGRQLGRLLIDEGYDVEKAMHLMGMGMAGQLRQAIINMNDPENSPVTALLKQRFPLGDQEPADVWQAFKDAAAGMGDGLSSKPLVWSGNMLNSVDHEVDLDG